MKKINIFLLTILSISLGLGVSKNDAICVKAADNQTKTINSTDWMSELPDGLRITDINIPAVHDAGTAHTTATVFSANTRCQTYYIGNHTYYNRNIFSANETITEPGLLEQGVRFFDIRYDRYSGYDPLDEDDVEDREEELQGLSPRDRALAEMNFASEHLYLAHGIYTCRYLVEDYYGWGDWEDVTNIKLMEWVKNFLDKHPRETVILGIAAEDDDAKDKERIGSLVYDFFHNLAVYGGFGKYPEMWIGSYVPTLEECRGKIVVVCDNNDWDFNVKDEDGNVYAHWAFMSGYSRGDEEKKDFKLAKTDPFMHSRVYKNNVYDGVDAEEKWVYIENGLNSAEGIHNKEVKNGYNPFMFLNLNENRVFLGTPRTFAEIVNPKVYDYINAFNEKKEYHFYGIILTDFINDEDIKSDLSETIWISNFFKDYSNYGYDFSTYNIVTNNNAPKTATIIGDGNIWVLVGGFVLLAGLTTVGVILLVKRNKKKRFKEAK